MFSAPESWKMSETEKVVAIIKEVECWRLGNWVVGQFEMGTNSS